MPLLIILFALGFNAINVYLQGNWIFVHGEYSIYWLTSKPFIAGLIIFFIGMYINITSDNILIALRKNNQDEYSIPKGFLFNKISSPNYLGEMIEWLGWAIMTWSFAGLVFFFWTVANLLPRALSNHKWYKKEFPEYPSERKAIIPYLF
jgi:steroid 5-alpha reductase family enzyme